VKIRYELTFKCRECGEFTIKSAHDVVESTDCPKCRRLAELASGSFVRVRNYTRKISPNQLKLMTDQYGEKQDGRQEATAGTGQQRC